MADESVSNAGSTPAPTAPADKAPTKSPAPTGSPRATEAPPEAQSAFERAKARRGSGAANTPASDSPAAGLSSGKTTIQKTREGGKSALEELKSRSRKHNPSAKTVESQVEVDDSALPNRGPSEVSREEEPEVEALAPAPGETEIPEGSSVSTPGGDHTLGEGVEPAPVETPVYEPKLKYTAFGKEHEIPEKFQALITDAESEREVHQVFERAHAFDRFKENLTQLDTQVKSQLVPEIQFHRQTRDQFNQLIQKEDVFGILGKMGLGREKVLQAVANRLRIEQLPPEQRQLYEAKEAAQATNEQAASQLQAMQQRVQQLESLAKHSTIQSTFARGDVQAVASDFDTRVGRPGAFEDLVRDHGTMMYYQGKDISPDQAVQAVMQRLGLTFKTPAQGNPQGAPSVSRPVTTSVRPASAPPTRVIPNIASRAVATTRSKPEIKNLDDLRKYRAQMRR